MDLMFKFFSNLILKPFIYLFIYKRGLHPLGAKLKDNRFKFVDQRKDLKKEDQYGKDIKNGWQV
jgi:hypothetical protein